MHELRLDPVGKNEMAQFRHIQTLIFPVSYPQSFYDDLLTSKIHLAYLIKYNERVIGVVSFRVETHAVYIMTLGILQPYRGKRLGSYALYVVEAFTIVNHKKKLICLHVNTSNKGAYNFYKSNGFVIHRVITNYYVKAASRDAYVLVKNVEKGNQRHIVENYFKSSDALIKH